MGFKGTVLAAQLADALKSVSPFATTDTTLPVLNAVHVATADGKLVATTTDRYTVGRYTVAYDGDQVAFTIPLRDVASILLTLKAVSKNKLAPAELILEGSRLTVKVWESEIAVTVNDAAGFPPVHSLFPAKEKAGMPSGRINFRPSLLAKFAKVVDDTKSGVMRMWCLERESVATVGGKQTVTTVSLPALVEIGDSFSGLIMPVRVG